MITDLYLICTILFWYTQCYHINKTDSPLPAWSRMIVIPLSCPLHVCNNPSNFSNSLRLQNQYNWWSFPSSHHWCSISYIYSQCLYLHCRAFEQPIDDTKQYQPEKSYQLNQGGWLGEWPPKRGRDQLLFLNFGVCEIHKFWNIQKS